MDSPLPTVQVAYWKMSFRRGLRPSQIEDFEMWRPWLTIFHEPHSNRNCPLILWGEHLPTQMKKKSLIHQRGIFHSKATLFSRFTNISPSNCADFLLNTITTPHKKFNHLIQFFEQAGKSQSKSEFKVIKAHRIQTFILRKSTTVNSWSI